MRRINLILAFLFLSVSNTSGQDRISVNTRAVSNSIPGDNTLRYYRLAIPVTYSAYVEDLGENYNNVLQFWSDCEEFANRMFVPLGICFDVVEDQRLVKTAYFPNEGTEDFIYTLLSNGTSNTNDLIGEDSYDVGMWVYHRDITAENSGLSAEGGVYSDIAKGNGYSKTDKWVVTHELGHLFGAPHTTTGEGSLMDSGGDDFFSYPSIKKIRDLAVGNGAGSANNAVKVSNSAPVFNNANMKDIYRIPQGACIAIPVYANDADGNMLTYSAIGCSSSTVGNIVEGGIMPHFASLIPQTSNVIDYSPKFTADINYNNYYYEQSGTNIPAMNAGSYNIAILVNDVPASMEYDYLVSNPFYSNYAVWDATVQIVGGTAFNASMSPAKNSYSAGELVTVSWGVNSNYFTADSRLRITMSTDYGKTFAYVLADNVPALNGSKAVTLPDVNVGNIDVDFRTATRSMRGGIIRVEEIGGVAYTLTTLSPENGGGFNITGGSGAPITYTISVTAGDGGTASIDGKSSTTVAAGSSVTLSAVPYGGYIFDGWYSGGSFVSLQTEYTFIPTASGTYNALFEEEAGTPVTYKITATANPIEGGTVTGGGTYNEGATVTLTATPNSGYEFVNWTSGTTTVSTSATYSFTANANADFVANFEQEVQDVLTTGYYHLVSRATDRNEHLYNNAFSSDNTYHFTLQSNTMVNTNNGIWYITKNGNQLGIKNGDGKPVVAGNSNNVGIMGTFSNLNIHTTINDAGDGYTYYYFNEALNCSDSNQNHFKVGGINYLTTWSGHPDATDNQWRFERVDTEDKNIYDVVVECTDKDVYVTYGSEYAFNGGFFITNETITAQQLTAKKNNAAVQDVTVLVEGKTIRVVDTEYVDITVSTTPAEGGSVTINGEATGTKRVIKGAEVTLAANSNNGYSFCGWYDGEDMVSDENPYTFTATTDITYTANFEQNVTFPDGAYKIFWQQDGRGYLAYHTGYPNEAKLADVTYPECQNKHFASTSPEVDLVWYLITAQDGNRYLFHAATGKFLTAGTVGAGNNAKANVLSTTEALPIRIEKNTAHSGHYVIMATVNSTDALLSSGCGTSSTSGTPVRWWYDNTNINFMSDGGSPLQFVSTTADVSDAIMNQVRLVIDGVDITANASEGGSVTINGEATGTKRVIKGAEVAVNAVPQQGYVFVGWYNGENKVYEYTEYTFTATDAVSLTARFEQVPTYTITATASPAEGGTATVNGKASVEVEANGTIELSAEANVGYTFVNWTNGGKEVTTQADCTIYNVAGNAEYVANFEQGAGAINPELDGYWFRIRKKDTDLYMNIANNYDNSGSTSGVTVAAKAADGANQNGDYDSDKQVFEFQKSGDGYKLKSKGLHYIGLNGSNVNASSIKEGAELTLEYTGQENEYRIMYNEDYFNTQDIGGGTYLFCKGSEGTVWILEEVAGYKFSDSYKALRTKYEEFEYGINPGSQVGDYTEECANTFNAALSVAKNVLSAANSTDDEYDEVCYELEKEKENLSWKIVLPEKNKYYVIRSAKTGLENNRIYAGSSTVPALHYDATAVCSKHVFTLERTQYDTYLLKSLERGTYLSSLVTEENNTQYEISGGENVAKDVTIARLSRGSRAVSITPYDGKMFNAGPDGKVVGYDNQDATSGSAWFIDEVDLDDIHFDVTMKTKFSSVTLGYNATVPAGVEAYNAVGLDDGYVSLVKVAGEGGVIPANTPVILYRTDGESETKAFRFTYTDETAEKPASTLLGGSLYTKYVKCDDNSDYYKLMMKDGEAKMYLMYKEFNAQGVSQGATHAGGHIKCSANKIYMRVPGGNETAVYSMRFIDSGVTDIDGVEGENGTAKAIYDLQGRKLIEISEPGFYIVDGKKIYVK